MHEEPLHLIPESCGRSFSESSVSISKATSAPPAAMVRDRIRRQHRRRAGERIFFSEEDRIGIGTFKPVRPENQDIAELTGIDFSTIDEYGAESDPRAYRFDGELNIANRGMMEFIEMLKATRSSSSILLTLAQEGTSRPAASR